MDKGKSLGHMILILSAGFFLTLLAAAILAQNTINLPLGNKSINFSLLISLINLSAYAFVAYCALGKIDQLGEEITSIEQRSQAKVVDRPHPALNPDASIGRYDSSVICYRNAVLK